jgi:hypothetical protein
MRFQNLGSVKVKRYYGVQGAGAIDVPGAPEVARKAGFVAEGLCRAGLVGVRRLVKWGARGPADLLSRWEHDPSGGSPSLG